MWNQYMKVKTYKMEELGYGIYFTKEFCVVTKVSLLKCNDLGYLK